MTKLKKLVLSGAPSTGKSSLIQALAEQNKSYILVPEAARVLLAGGYPAPDHNDIEQIRSFQKTIIPVHQNLEYVFERKYPQSSAMILDRALLDGAGFWPLGKDDYFKIFNVDHQRELEKYDHVVFMELPTRKHFGGIHKERFHDFDQSLESEKNLRDIWSKHSSFHCVGAEVDFATKLKKALDLIQNLLM